MKPIKAFFQTWVQKRNARKVTWDRACTRVRRGAEYLDDVDPSWYRRVNADTLELSSGGSCILGQLHGDFRMGLTRSRLYDLSSAPRANLSPVAFGFHCHYNVGEELQRKDYEHLTRAWQEVIQKRQKHDDLSGDTLPASADLHVNVSVTTFA